MKVGIVYYSRTGNTKRAAEIFEEKLKEKKINVDLIEIESVKRPSYLKASISAVRQKDLPIKNTDYNLNKYDVLLVGSPVWAGKPTPFIKTFFNKALNIKGKKSAVFITCSSSPDSQLKAAEIIKEDLEKLGVKQVNALIALNMKEEEIRRGKKKIEGFIMDIFSK